MAIATLRRFTDAVLMPILALVVLNLALGLHNVWPTPWITTRLEISIEAVIIVLMLAASIRFRGTPSRRAIGAWALLVLLLVVGRYADVTAPSLYGRPINLYWDAQHLPQVVAMMARAAPGWQIGLGLAGLALAVGAMFLVLCTVMRSLASALVASPARRLAYVGGFTLIALFAVGELNLAGAVRGWFARPVTQSYAGQLGLLRDALASQTAQDFAESPLSEVGLERVAGADVLVLFIESYGATTYDRPEQLAALSATRERLAKVISGRSGQVASAFVTSPTFGGGSWFAHASFLSGLEIRDKRRYNLLLASARDSLVQRFSRKGYRALGLMPGIRQAWPEGSYYGFDAVYDAKALDYTGPAFGWWTIPDQFALARVDHLELQARDRAPVFLFFTTISSHAPFVPVPAYQPSWEKLLGPRPYEPLTEKDPAGQGPDWGNLGVSYVRSVDYALSWLTGYLQERAPKDAVLVVIGDHQPAASVTGPQASWDVPVHVITNRPVVIDALQANGFSAGLDPPRMSIGPMHSLSETLLRAFSAPAPGKVNPALGS